MPRQMENTAEDKTLAASGALMGPALAMGSMIISQLGIAVCVPLMVAHGSFGISALRLGFAALFCLAWVRPNFRRFDRRQWIGAFALGVTMALMTMCFFTAAKLIPMGPAITIDFLGPLGVAVLALRGCGLGWFCLWWPRSAYSLCPVAAMVSCWPRRAFCSPWGRPAAGLGISF
jgi:inner membrane transporter RhtA